MNPSGLTMLALVVISLAGCLPIPDHYQVTADVSGVLMRDNVALAGVQICSKSKFLTTTSCSTSDSHGHFRLAPVYNTTFPMSLYGDRLISYELTATENATSIAIWRAQGTGQATTYVRLSCALDKPIPGASYGTSSNTFCAVERM